MIEWETTVDGIRIVDAVDNEVSIAIPDWSPVPAFQELSRPTDVEFAGTAQRLTIPTQIVRVYDLGTGESFDTPTFVGGATLDEGSFLAVLPATIHLYLRFEGPASVAFRPAAQELEVALEVRQDVQMGARSNVRAPAETITIPRSVQGVATALSHMGAAHRTITPDRSFWTMRRHPPAIEFGTELDVPEHVASRTPETGIELRLPESLQTLFVAAPLAYYLGASVTLQDGCEPRLLAPAAGVEYSLGPDVVECIPATLARVFWLDCLARNGGPHAEPDLVEHDLLTDVGIEHEHAYEASPAERLALYLDAPYQEVADELPEWPLSMHVDPSMAHVSTLPFLLNHLSFIYPPETAELGGPELMERSLDDFYRSPPGPIASVEMLKPKLRRGRLHGWLAEGTPIDVFKTLPEAYENYIRYLETDDAEEMSVVVVLNDRDMTGEHERVAEIYQERASDSRMNVRLEEELSCSELAAIFAEPHEFLHYIGHCEVDGLRCSDGNLSVADLDRTNVQTFFLNACGSYYEGLELVRKGAIAGAVTFRKVLDEQAAKVGTAFAHLLISGFPIEPALRLARRRIMMGKDYVVVGNGMQTITMEHERATSVAYVDTRDSGDLRVSWDMYTAGDHGSYYRVTAGEPTRPRLTGNRTEFRLGPDELATFIADEDLPVILDGEFFWSHEIVDRFEPDA